MLPLLALAACLGGCSSAQKISALSGTTGGWYSVAANQTAFYHYGPQQGHGPDQQLPKDALMKVIRPSFGYVKVQLQNGENGYVASEDIRTASAALVAEKLAPPLEPPAPLIANHEEQFQMNSNDPRLIAPPEPLPEPFPAESAAPEFR
ncbi:MAG: hypothetical protein H0X34_10720 [Chthoniobacterales bacterium]|nr:hypothetical protein [Chthoniobacterales bacterium]